MKEDMHIPKKDTHVVDGFPDNTYDNPAFQQDEKPASNGIIKQKTDNDRRIVSGVSSMLDNNSHPMYETVMALGSTVSDRLLHPKYEKERYRRSFLPTAVRLYNQQAKRRSLHTEN